MIKTTLLDILEDIQARMARAPVPRPAKLLPLLTRRGRHLDLIKAFDGDKDVVEDLYPRKNVK